MRAVICLKTIYPVANGRDADERPNVQVRAAEGFGEGVSAEKSGGVASWRTGH
jgi:hypothetical protein